VFFGTPEWAVPSLVALLASDIEVAAVVTNPDRPAGRGLRERVSPVKEAAQAAGIDVLQPARARDLSFRQQLEDLSPEVACVVAYGKLLPAELLAIPPLGFVNAHFSLLPAYRGAAPVQWTLINGDAVTGISIMVLSEGMDEGPLLDSEKMAVEPSDTAATLGERLARTAAPLLVETVTRYGDGLIAPIPQPDSGVSFAPKLKTDDVRIDWSRPARDIHNLIRGANPEPGAWTTWRGKRMKILGSAPSMSDGQSPVSLPVGHVNIASDALIVGSGAGSLLVTRAQLEGRRPLPSAELARGLHLHSGDRFE
jgi:methionyl-tRNA formyltransferase